MGIFSCSHFRSKGRRGCLREGKSPTRVKVINIILHFFSKSIIHPSESYLSKSLN